MKSLINSALLKEQLKRFWAIAALALLAYVLFVIFPIYQMNQTNGYWSVTQLSDIFSMRNPVMLVASILVPLVTVLVTFSYLFQSKSTTTMHAYPISKNQLFFTNVLAGFILIVIPLLILCVVLLIPVKFTDLETYDAMSGMYYRTNVRIPIELFPNGVTNGDIMNTFPIVVGFFLRTLLTFIFYYATFLIAAIIAGNAIIYVLVSGVLPFIPSGLFLLAQMTGFYYCFGFEMNSVSLWSRQLLIYTNPTLFGLLFNFYYPIDIVSSIITTNFIPYIISYVLIAAVLFALSFWFNRLRRQERASDSIVFNPIKNVLIFLFSLLGMMMLGMFFFVMFKGVVYMYIGFVIGFTITYFIAQMIAEKSFNIFLNKAKDLVKFGGVAIGLFLVVIFVTKFDLIGYSTYTPNLEDVSGVYFNYYPYEYFYEVDNKDLTDNFFIKDTEIISDAVAIQKKIVDSKDELRSVFLQSASREWYSDKYGQITGQYFIFKLKNGELITRYYVLPQSFVEESGLDMLLLTDEAILAPYYAFKSPQNIDKVVIDYQNSKNQINSINIERPEQIISILEEIKKDIVIVERKRISSSKETAVKSETQYLNGYIELKKNVVSHGYNGFSLENYDNTKAWLIDNGYELIN